MEAQNGGWIHGGESPELPFSNTDTSLDAAKSVQYSAGSIRSRVFRFIKSCGKYGATDDEIEIWSGMRHQTISARRRELVLNDSITYSGIKRNTRSGRKAQVWVAG